MSNDMMSLFTSLDDNSDAKTFRDEYIRAPFAYPGGKGRSLEFILPNLPYRKSYIEPFGGSGVVLMNRNPSELEVFNDRFAGVVAFYRCIHDYGKMRQLGERLDCIVHSREEFLWSKATWENCEDDVERAARWYYMVMASFGSIGRNFGRSVNSGFKFSNKVANHIKDFPILHHRLRNVTIENQDWRQIMSDYDNPNAAFYLDPPYPSAWSGTYKHEMSIDEHKEMLERVFAAEGFCAVSSYHNELYDSYKWDHIEEWEVAVSIKGMAFTESNYKEDLKNDKVREKAIEVLYIKY